MASDSHTTIDVQNCQAIKSIAELGKGDWAMEPKLDGFRLLAHVKSPTEVLFYTRSKKRQDGKLPHLVSELGQIFPPGTILDGEIVAMQFEGERIINDFEYVQSVMLSLPARSVQVQEQNRWLRYIVFDMIQIGDLDIRDEPYRERVKALGAGIAAAGAKYTMMMQSWDATEEIHTALVANGFEGTVIKDRNSRYASGYRGRGWHKIKNNPTVDVVVLGQGKAGEGKNIGLVGSVRFGHPISSASDKVKASKRLKTVELAPVKGGVIMDAVQYVDRGQAGGMTDEERIYITEHLDELIGTVIEVSHNGIFPDGVKMRHPQFVRFRADRTADSVTWHDR